MSHLWIPLLLWTATATATQFEVGPILQDVRADGVTVMWETDAATPGEVVVTTAAGELRFPSTATAHRHAVRVGGLPPGRHPYRVVAGDATSGAAELAPARQGDAFTFLVYGDNRDRDADHARVVAAMVPEHADLALNTGDLVGDGGNEALWRRFFAIEQPLLSSVPMYPALGNHEILRDPLATHFHRHFALPVPPPAPTSSSLPRRWYSFRYGNSRFIALDGNQSRSQPQARWLRGELERATADATVRHTFVYFHQPPFSVGGFCGSAAEQGLWVPQLEQHQVRAVFSSHDHSYQRLERNGVRYFVTGGGGAPLHRQQKTCPAYDMQALRRFASVHHHLRVRVRGEQATLEALAVDGTLLDAVELRAALPPPVVAPPTIGYLDVPLADLPLAAGTPALSERAWRWNAPLVVAGVAGAALLVLLSLLAIARRRRR